MGKTRKGKGTKIVLMVDGEGLPLSALTTSAQDAEVHTIETLVDLHGGRIAADLNARWPFGDGEVGVQGINAVTVVAN